MHLSDTAKYRIMSHNKCDFKWKTWIDVEKSYEMLTQFAGQ
jgi:hypothetical protein